jgi:hypothetical protein
MDVFPSVKARDLEGRDVHLPDDLPAGPRVVLLAFKRWQQELVDSWEPALAMLESHCRRLSVWDVPALSRVYLPVRGFIDGGMRSGIVDPSARQHTLTAYTDLSALARALRLPSLDTIYVLLLAPDGTIVWRGEGAADDGQVEAARRALEGLACDA